MIEASNLSFDCTINGDRCSKCCEVIHVTKETGRIVQGKSKFNSIHRDDELTQQYWKPISKRCAKKKNPYMFGTGWNTDSKNWLRKKAAFFRCAALIDGKCSVYESRPGVCRQFSGSGMYRYECAQENYEKSSIIARDTEK